MKTLFFRNKALIITILSILCAAFMAFAVASVRVLPVSAAETAAVTGVQVRSWGIGNGYDFIVLQNSAYSAITADTTVSGAENYNTRSKVKIYTSETDTAGKYLTEICGIWWTQNLWGSGGLMLAVDDYNTYNGTTIYKITVEAGCQLPCGDTVYETAETVSYINNDFGKADSKNGAFNWTRVADEIGTASLNGVQVRSMGAYNDPSNGHYGYNFIALLSNVYDTTPSGKADISNFNTREKIKIYTSATEGSSKSLSELIGSWYEYEQFNQNGLMLAYNTPSDYATYNGKTIYKIVIEKGCQLPYGQYGYYVTSEEYTFYNTEFGSDDVINGAFKWSTDPQFETEISLTGVQMRGAHNGWYYYLVLRSDSYSEKTSTEGIDGATDITVYGYDKIRLYTSADDTTGKPLSELTLQHIGCNQWGENGLFINFAEYDNGGYGGHQIYKITIEKGCALPSGDGKFFVVDKDYYYTNDDYGNSDKKLEAYRWVGSLAKAEFIADGKTIATREFIYGVDTVIADVPAVPAKDGYTVRWQDYSLDAVPKVIYAEYFMGYAYGRSISLEGEISVNFYIRLLDDEATVTLASTKGDPITLKGSEADTKTINDTVYKVFSYRLAAKDYDADVTLSITPSITTNGEKGITVSSSVKEYAEETAKDGATSSNLKDLAQSLLNYCSAAKAYFGNETVEAYTGEVALDSYKPVSSGTAPSGVTLNGATLVLESKTAIKIYFSGENASSAVCTVNGETVEQTREDDYYVITIENVVAQKLDEAYTITIGDLTINYSALSYAYAVAGNSAETDANLINLVKYLYDYNVKAKDFF